MERTLLIGFNSRFINEMLNNLSSELIRVELSSPNRAGLISPVSNNAEKEDIIMLVMPINVKLEIIISSDKN